MRRTYRKSDFKELNRQILFIGAVFILFVVIGTYLNKIYPSYQEDIVKNIEPVRDYYSSGENIKVAVLSNFKSDLYFIIKIGFFSLLVITFPIVFIIFMLKGLSIGYTINSTILALNFEAIKFIFILLIKNLAIIPGVIILILVSIDYIKKVIYEIKGRKKENIIFLVKRFLLNVIIIIGITILLQVILNTISIGIIKFLVR